MQSQKIPKIVITVLHFPFSSTKAPIYKQGQLRTNNYIYNCVWQLSIHCKSHFHYLGKWPNNNKLKMVSCWDFYLDFHSNSSGYNEITWLWVTMGTVWIPHTHPDPSGDRKTSRFSSQSEVNKAANVHFVFLSSLRLFCLLEGYIIYFFTDTQK